MKHSKFITISNSYLKSLFSDSTEHCNELTEKRQRILDTLDKHKEIINHIDQLITDFEQQKVRMNPTVYISKARTPLNKDITYFYAKTFYPFPNGKRKEVKIYLGRAEKFNNDKHSIQVKNEAVRKMRETLNRRFNEGSLEK